MYRKFAAMWGPCLVVVAVMYIAAPESEAQMRPGETQLTAADVLPIIEAVANDVARSHESSTTRSVSRVLVDGPGALRAFRRVVPDMPLTYDALGAESHFGRPPHRLIICTPATDCIRDHETIYLSIGDVQPGREMVHGLAEGEYLVIVGVQAGDSRELVVTDAAEQMIGVTRSDGGWRTTARYEFHCICARAPCSC